MRKPQLALAILMIALPLMSTSLLTGCISSDRKESTGQYIDSSAITVKVKSKLVADESIKSLAIGVATYKGVVQLSGFVDTAEQKQTAIEIARQVPGVKGVVDALVVKTQ
jgi:osmotically-inducible protein OsmY